MPENHDIYTPDERRVWQFLIRYPDANADAVASMTGAPLQVAIDCVNRIGTPYAVRAMDAAQRPRSAGAEPSAPVLEGKKFDSGKARYDLIPPEVEEAIAKVLTFGAEKYGERNWELGMKWGRPYAALRRHMAAWWSGEDKDSETGMPHTWHAACCLAFIIAYEARGAGSDDRPRHGGET